MAPMFLVSNTRMVIEAAKAGITGAIPALNYRNNGEFRRALNQLKQDCPGPFGINLIVNKSNFRLKEQLAACIDFQVDYIITSLGSPQAVIEASHQHGVLVFCDVTDERFAKKVEALGADGLIAVNAEAGGHAGPMPADQLVPLLRKSTKLPVISAGGVGTASQLRQKLALGADGVSVGSVFIATDESAVSDDYKNACIAYGAADIVMTTKLSGTPCTVINTPYVQATGTKQNWLEALLNKHKRLKKLAMGLTFWKGMKALQKAAFSATYKTVWCAGPSIEHVRQVRPVAEVVHDLVRDVEAVENENL